MAWVFVRSNGVWTQQAQLPTIGGGFGQSVALSADGNTALIGAWETGNNDLGAAAVFTRSNGVWTLQNDLFR